MLNGLTSLEALRVSAVILDPSGTIVGVNDAWKEFGRRNGLGLRNDGLGANYLDHCADDDASGSTISGDLRGLLVGRLDLVTRVYPCNSEGKPRWFVMLAFPLASDGPGGIAILHAELSSFVPAPIIESENYSGPIPCTTLTKRQLEVLRLLGEGKTNAEIAKALCRSPHTIKLHVSAILRELNLKSRTQAAVLASRLPQRTD